MYMVKELSETSLEIKKSRFVSYLMPFSSFDSFMSQIKAEHPRASHFVSASRFFDSSGRLAGQQSDDGEPKGSSGKPTLSLLSGYDMVESSIITVRYFGGIKLGVGGLVRAYSDSARKAILSAKLHPWVRYLPVGFRVPYSHLGKFEHTVGSYNTESLKKDFQGEEVIISFGIDEKDHDHLLSEFRAIRGIRLL